MAHLSPLSLLLMLVLLSPKSTGLYPNISEISTTWTQLSASLPQPGKWIIGGYCNITQKIWIFGGRYTLKRVLSLDPNIPSAVVQYSDSLNTFPAYQRGGISDALFYFNSPLSPYISRFFTTNVSFEYQFARHIKDYTDFEVLPWKIDTDTVLFVLGGSTGANEMYIMNTSSKHWHQAPDYNVSFHRHVSIILDTHIYRVTNYKIEYMEITCSIEDIISRKWQISAMNDSLEWRYPGTTAFYNKYSHDYELWVWGGYDPISKQLSGIRVVNTKTFGVTEITTYPNYFADALEVYVPSQDLWYVIGGHWGTDRNTIYSVSYSGPYEPSAAPSFGPTTVTPTRHPSQIPSTEQPSPTKQPSRAPTEQLSRMPTEPPSVIKPTLTANAPNMNPSSASSTKIVSDSTMAIITTSVTKERKGSGSGFKMSPMVIIILIMVGFTFFMAVVIVYCVVWSLCNKDQRKESALGKTQVESASFAAEDAIRAVTQEIEKKIFNGTLQIENTVNSIGNNGDQLVYADTVQAMNNHTAGNEAEGCEDRRGEGSVVGDVNVTSRGNDVACNIAEDEFVIQGEDEMHHARTIQ